MGERESPESKVRGGVGNATEAELDRVCCEYTFSAELVGFVYGARGEIRMTHE